MGFFPIKKTIGTDVFERLTKQIVCNHDHDHGICPKHPIGKFNLSRNRRPSKSWHTSPLNHNNKNGKNLTTFSKFFDSTNYELDEKKIQSMMSIDNNFKEETGFEKEAIPFIEELNYNSHKDYLIGKLCEKLRKLNSENRSLSIRIENLELKHFEISNVMKTSEKLENELAALEKERISLRIEHSKDQTQNMENSKEMPEEPKESKDLLPNNSEVSREIDQNCEESDQMMDLPQNIENKQKDPQKQEKGLSFEKNETYENLIYNIKTLEMDRNRYYEQMITIQKKNEAFFIENSELFKNNQRLIAENEAVHSKLRFLESTTSLKKKSSPIFKSIFTNESTVETEDELVKHSPNDEIIKEVNKKS